MPDPRLKKAMAEIRALCRRYDIGGQITLVSQSHAEFGYFPPIGRVSEANVRCYIAEQKTR